MNIFEALDNQKKVVGAGDPSLAFITNEYCRYDEEIGKLYYEISFHDIQKYNFSSFLNRNHYDSFSVGKYYETGMTYYEDNEKKLKRYILAFYTKEDEYNDDEVRKIEFVDRHNKITVTQDDIKLVFSVSLIEDKMYIEDEGILYNDEIVSLDKINIMCQFYDMRHETETSRKIFYDETKITFSTITMKRIATKNGIITKHINSRTVMNLATGRTYKLNDYDLIAKRKTDLKRRPFMCLTAWNSNWLCTGVSTITAEDFNKIGKTIEKAVNDKDVIPFEEYTKDLKEDKFQVLVAYNANPFVPYSILINMYLTKEDAKRELNNYDKLFTKKFNCKVLRNKDVKKELFAFLLTQGYSKKFLEYKFKKSSPTSIVDDKKAYDEILELESIKDKNNKWKIVQSYFEHNYSIYELKDFYDSNLYAELKKTHKETDIVNAAIKIKDIYYLYDLSHSYNKIIRTIPEYKLPVKRLRLTEIHDVVCNDAKKLDDNTFEYHYSEDIQDRFNKRINEYDFVLATDNLQLVEVGTEMGICVGSYGRRVANKQCVIVYMKKDNKYVGCIEILPDGTTNQVKGIRNNSLLSNELVAFTTYAELVKIDTRKCCDLTVEYRKSSNRLEVNINETEMFTRVPIIKNGQIDFTIKKYEHQENDCWF